MNCFQLLGITNCPREIGRSVERKFGVTVNKERVDFTSRYGQKNYYYKYKLIKSKDNLEGVKKMAEYVKSQTKNDNPRTEKQKKELRQMDLFLSGL